MSEIDELIADAEIGELARKFLESDLGKTMLGMAQQDVQEAKEALGDVDPTDTKKIASLQDQAKAARKFETYLTELIIRGNQALVVWKFQQEEVNA